MMQRYYDFTTDPKAQGFIKPSHTLSNITTAPVTTVSTHTFTSDPNAAQWSYSKTTNLEGVFVLPSMFFVLYFLFVFSFCVYE